MKKKVKILTMMNFNDTSWKGDFGIAIRFL